MDDLFGVFAEAQAEPRAPELPSALGSKPEASVQNLHPYASSRVSPEVFAEFRPQIVEETFRSEGDKGCISEICFPPDWNGQCLRSSFVRFRFASQCPEFEASKSCFRVL